MEDEQKDENVITYETFRKFQKQERDSENLQKLPDDFFQSCAEWIKRKGDTYQQNKDTMILKEIENVMSIIRDILDRRERKLLLMAMHAVRSNAAPQNLHKHEENHFDSIVNHLKDMREKILAAIKGEDIKEFVPEKEKSTEKLEKEFKKEVKKAENEAKEKNSPQEKQALPITRQEKSIQEDTFKGEENKEEKDSEDDLVEVEPEPGKKKEEEEPGPIQIEPGNSMPKIIEQEGYMVLRVMEEVPKFLGTGGKTYGPFGKDDIVTVEEKMAKLLIDRGKAETANKS